MTVSGGGRAAGFGAMVAMLLLTAGCSTLPGGRAHTTEPLPPSNGAVLGAVLAEALGAVDLPADDGRPLRVRCAGDSAVASLVANAATAAWAGTGWRVVSDDGGLPCATIGVDTLGVTITESVTRLVRRTYERTADAVLSVEYESAPGIVQIYRAEAHARDRVPPEMAVDGGPFPVEVVQAGRTVASNIKPFGIALIMSVLVWSLYSYRG